MNIRTHVAPGLIGDPHVVPPVERSAQVPETFTDGAGGVPSARPTRQRRRRPLVDVGIEQL